MMEEQPPATFAGHARVTPESCGLFDPRTWRVEVVVDEALAQGSAIYLAYLGMARQRATLQQERPGEDGYWWVEAPGLSFRCEWYQLSAAEVIKLTLTSPASAGAHLTLHVVDLPRSAKNDMGQHLHAWETLPFPVFLRRPGDDRLLRLRKLPSASIRPGEPAYLRAFGPSTLSEGATVLPLRLASFDAELNPVPLPDAEFLKVCACGRHRFVARRMGGLSTAKVPLCTCQDVSVTDPTTGLRCRLNPRRHVRPGDCHLFWGEIHTHGHYDDGARDADYTLQFARNAACLDFAAISIHDHFAALVRGVLSQYSTRMWGLAERVGYDWEAEFRAISDAVVGVAEGQSRWDFVLAKTAAYNEPGRFVTLPGYEWTASTYTHLERATGLPGGHGHRCVYFRGENPPLFCSRDERYSSPDRLFTALAPYRGRVLTIPHHPAAHPQHKSGGWNIDWTAYNPDFDRLAEVFSCHGSSEYPGNPRPIPGKCGLEESFVRWAIAHGCRLGIVAGTDNHEGRPGQVDGGWGDSPGGMIGVWAAGLTREDIFDALFSRRCYGVSNMARIVLEFRLNHAPMGSELRLTTGEQRRLDVRVQGTAPIEDIQIIKNGRPWRAWKLRGNRGSGEVAHVDDEEPGEMDSYYVTILQRDGEMAWSSPIWVQAR